MARAHHEMPMAEQPPERKPHGTGTEAESKAKPAKRRARSAPPIPEEALRPKKRAAKKAEAPVINRIKPFKPSEEAKMAAELYHRREKNKQAAAAEDLTHEAVEDDGEDYAEMTVEAQPQSEVGEALDVAREAIEEGAWDQAIGDAKKRIEKEEASQSDVERSLSEVKSMAARRAREDKGWDEKIAKAKSRLGEEKEVSDEDIVSSEDEEKDVAESDIIGSEDEPEYAEYSVAEQPKKDEEEMDEEERALAAYKEAHPVLTDNEGYRKLGMKAQAEEALSKGYEARRKREAKEAAAKEKVGPDGFTEKEAAWFKGGEEEEASQMAEARATIERGGKGELVVEDAGDIAANVQEAAALFKQGDLSPRDFSVQDYEYLLKERVRIDKELEHAGWWQARKLRKELAQVQKGGYNGAPNGLEDYEAQIMAAKQGNATARQVEKEQAAKASGAPPKKPSFWQRLRMDKGR